jgi:hypothetical protein
LVSSARRWREPRSWPGRSHLAPHPSRRPRSWPRPLHLGGGVDAESSPGLVGRGDGDAKAIPSAGDPLLAPARVLALPCEAPTRGTRLAVVLTFEVGRVYKGTAGKRQEVLTSLGSAHAHSRAPFVIFANKPSPAMSHQYEVDLGQYTFGLESRALAGGARGRGT